MGVDEDVAEEALAVGVEWIVVEEVEEETEVIVATVATVATVVIAVIVATVAIAANVESEEIVWVGAVVNAESAVEVLVVPAGAVE